MPRLTKDEQDAELAAAEARGAGRMLGLAKTLSDQGLQPAVIIGALAGLAGQLSEEAAELHEAARAKHGSE
jgi:hypothetical protein